MPHDFLSLEAGQNLSFTTDTHLGMVTGAENDEDDAMMTAIDVLRRVVND
jgi:hypothetical protein